MMGLTFAELRQYVQTDAETHGVRCRMATGARVLIDCDPEVAPSESTVYLLPPSSRGALRSLWEAERRGDVIIVDCTTPGATDRVLAAMGGIEDIEDVQSVQY